MLEPAFKPSILSSQLVVETKVNIPLREMPWFCSGMLTTFLTRTPLVYKGQVNIRHGVSELILNGISQNRIGDTCDPDIWTTSLGFLICQLFSNSQFLEHSQMTEQYQNLKDLVDYATSPTKKKGIGANLWTTAGFLDYYITGLSWSPRRTNWCKNTNTENRRTVKCKGYDLFFWQSNLPKPGFCLFIKEVTSDVAWL